MLFLNRLKNTKTKADFINVEKLAEKILFYKLEAEQILRSLIQAEKYPNFFYFLSIFNSHFDCSVVLIDIRPALRRVVTAMVKPYMWNMGSSRRPFFPIYPKAFLSKFLQFKETVSQDF
jgi:hypothetical protein